MLRQKAQMPMPVTQARGPNVGYSVIDRIEVASGKRLCREPDGEPPLKRGWPLLGREIDFISRSKRSRMKIQLRRMK